MTDIVYILMCVLLALFLTPTYLCLLHFILSFPFVYIDQVTLKPALAFCWQKKQLSFLICKNE